MAGIHYQEGRTTNRRDAVRARLSRSLALRATAGSLLTRDAERVARACYAMSERFHRGGKLITFGAGSSSTDAQHVAVEFLHPVIVGKRTLPALALTNDVATITGVACISGFDDTFAHQIRHLSAPEDIVLGIDSGGPSPCVTRALDAAHERNLLTIAMTADDHVRGGSAIDFEFVAHSDDPMIVKEIQVTTYHIIWELVHVFFERPGLFPPGFAK
ncbi:MAG: D-sedoheptulose-7-phosphate isomerase [Candidatus Binataceae bacterium]